MWNLGLFEVGKSEVPSRELNMLLAQRDDERRSLQNGHLPAGAMAIRKLTPSTLIIIIYNESTPIGFAIAQRSTISRNPTEGRIFFDAFINKYHRIKPVFQLLLEQIVSLGQDIRPELIAWASNADECALFETCGFRLSRVLVQMRSSAQTVRCARQIVASQAAMDGVRFIIGELPCNLRGPDIPDIEADAMEGLDELNRSRFGDAYRSAVSLFGAWSPAEASSKVEVASAYLSTGLVIATARIRVLSNAAVALCVGTSVLPNFRQSGLGRLLKAHAIVECMNTSSHVDSFLSFVDERNLPMLKINRSLAFEQEVTLSAFVK